MSFVRLLFITFTFFCFVSCESLKNKPSLNFLGPILEVVNDDGKLNYTGRVVNNSGKEISTAFLRYVARNKDGKIIEAITVPIIGSEGSDILEGEVINFDFTLRIETRNVHSKQVTLDYRE